MAVTAIDVVKKFAPNAKPAYFTAFQNGGAALAAAEITTPLRLAHFMAQCLHETGGLTILTESGRYSAKNLADMWDDGNWHKYFANRDACIAMADQCKIDGGVKLFSLVYGNRMGNGPPPTEDGWKFRGRGILQTTGRESYGKFGKRATLDFETTPELVIDPNHALKPALMEWTDKRVGIAADLNDIEAVTIAINGGRVGIKGRKLWFARIWSFIVGAPPPENTTEWKVQAALIAAGYNPGDPDGDVGPNTRLAIIRYRADRKLPSGSQIGPDLITALGI